MTREVKVKVKADTAEYVAPVAGATETTEKFDDKVKQTNDDLGKTAPAAAKAAAAMKLLGDEGGKTKVALEDGIGKNSTSLGVLDQKLQAARAEVRRLADEFNKTGDAGTLSKLFDAKNVAGDLEKLQKQLTSAMYTGTKTGLDLGGKEGSKSIFASIQGVLSTPIVGPITVGIAAAIAPALAFVVPMLNAALVSGGGFALLAGGVAGALQSQQVRDAASGLGSTLKSVFLDATSSFRNPVENALLDLTDFSRHLDLRSVFAPLAQYVAPLEKGLEGFLSRLTAGLAYFAEHMKPLVDVFVAHLPQFGAIVESFLQRVSRNAGENASAFDLLLTVLENVVRLIGGAIEAFDHMYKVAINVALGIAVAFDKAFGWVPVVGKQLDDNVLTLARLASEANGGVVGGFDNAATAADGLNGAVGPNGLGKSVLGTKTAFEQLDQATLQWKNDALDAKTASLNFKDALSNLKDQMKQNGAGFDENTTAGRQNTEQLNALAQSAQDVADKVYASTGNSQAAAQAYIQAKNQVMELAKQGHASASEIAALNQALDNAVKIRKGSIDIEVNLTGSGKALVTNQGVTILSGTGRKLERYGGVYEHAETGLVSAGIYSPQNPARYAFAEPATGGEAFVPKYGDYQRSTGIIDTAARWYGGRFVPTTAAAAAPQVFQPVINARVFVGDREITDIVRVEVDAADQRTAGAVAGGVRV